MTALFPSEHVVLHWLETPSAPRRKWPELLPWLLEERLLSPVEELVCLPLAEQEGKLLVLVVARTVLRSVLDGYKVEEEKQGREVTTLVPDYVALPWAENQIAVADRGDGFWVVRYGQWEGFAAPASLACTLVEQLLEQQTQANLRLWLAQADLTAALRARAPGVEGRFDWRSPPPIAPALARTANLRKGEFASPAKDGATQWWPTAALLVLGLVLVYLAPTLDTDRLRAEVAMLEKRQPATFASLFPGLNVSGSNAGNDLREAVEQRVNGRFLQRQQLNKPVAIMLQNLDHLLRNCHRCELSALELQAGGGSLQLSAGSTEAPFQHSAMQVSSSNDEIRVAFTAQALAEIAAGAAR